MSLFFRKTCVSHIEGLFRTSFMVYGAPPNTILKVHQTCDGTDTTFLQTPTSFKISERGGKKEKYW